MAPATRAPAPDLPMTVGGFLAWSADHPRELRHELVRGQPVRLMAPTNLRHGRIQRNAGDALKRAIAARGLRCEVFESGPGVAIDDEGDECRIPDVVVTCAASLDEAARIVPEPVIIVEVASDSTRLSDINDEVEFYGAIASVRHYLVIEQAHRRAVYHGRGADGRLEPRIVRGGTLVLDPPGIELALDAVYVDTGLEAG